MIPKGASEFVNRRRTDNTMEKRKMTKGQTTIYKSINTNKAINHLLHQLIEDNKRPPHHSPITMQVLAWNSCSYVAELNNC
jgi:hypothetical protein